MKRRRRRRDEEQTTIAPKKRDDALAGQGTRQGDVAQLQRQYGNAYVQRMVQRQEDDSGSGAGVMLDEANEYKFNVPVKMTADGLQLDLKRGIELKNYDVDSQMLPHKIKQWLGISEIMLGAEGEAEGTEVECQTDGKLILPLSAAILGQMSALTSDETESTTRFDPNLPFGTQGLEAEAEMVFNSAELEDLDIDNKDKFLDNKKSIPGIFITIDFHSKFPAQGVGEQEPFEGTLLLMAVF